MTDTKQTTELQTKATLALGWMDQGGPRVGTDKKFWKFKDGRPEVLQTLAHDAHADFMPDDSAMLPDDYRYEFIYQALERLAEWEDMDAADAWEPAIYNHERMSWVASHPYRVSYVEDAVRDAGLSMPEDISLMDGIAYGMSYEFSVVEFSVRDSLESLSVEDLK